jgi:hypothetical protein
VIVPMCIILVVDHLGFGLSAKLVLCRLRFVLMDLQRCSWWKAAVAMLLAELWWSEPLCTPDNKDRAHIS